MQCRFVVALWSRSGRFGLEKPGDTVNFAPVVFAIGGAISAAHRTAIAAAPTTARTPCAAGMARSTGHYAKGRLTGRESLPPLDIKAIR